MAKNKRISKITPPADEYGRMFNPPKYGKGVLPKARVERALGVSTPTPSIVPPQKKKPKIGKIK